MKKIYNLRAFMVLIPLFSSLFFLQTETVSAQSCNQVEILYQDLDCDKGQHPDEGSNAGRCKSASACKDQSYPYSAAGSGWASYNWTVTGPATVAINPNSTSQNITIVWPLMGVYTLTLTVTDGSGNTFTTCLSVTVKDKPVAGFTFSPNNVCAGSTISFTNGSTYSGGMVYSWNFGDPTSGTANFSALANPTHLYGANGVYNVTLIVSGFTTVIVPGGGNGQENTVIKTCCSDTITKTVTIVAGNMDIQCISTVCAGDTATYTAVGCANPTWLAPTGGTILSQSGNQVTIIWGNGAVQGVIVAQCPGGCIASVPVPIIPTNPVPTGNLSPCTTSTTSYTLPVLPGTFYTWHLNDATPTNYDYLLTTYPDNNTAWINWNMLPAGSYQLTIDLDNKHLCCTSSGTITIVSKGTFAAYADQTVCKGNAAYLSVYPIAGTFNWSVSPSAGVVPATGSGSSFSPVFNNTGNYVVTITETGNTYCNTTQQVKIKVINIPVPGSISGPSNICPGSEYTYTMSTAAPAGTYYNWQISGSAGTFEPGSLVSTTGNSVNIAWTSVPATISVTLQYSTPPACPSLPVILGITQAVIGTLTGPPAVCVDDSLVYTLSGGTLPLTEDVQWTISPPSLGSVIAGQGTNSPKILWHGQVTGAGPWIATIQASSNCGSTVFTVSITKKPVFTLAQTGDICQPGGAILTATGAGPYTYTWSNAATGATTSVSAAGFYTATATSGSCSFSRSIEVKDPFNIVGTTCGVGFCNGINTNETLGVQVLKPGSGTFTYEWYSGIFPAGTLLTAVTNSALSNSYTALAPGTYYAIVKYGTCQKSVSFTVQKVCCPDVNQPQITHVTQVTCNQYAFTGTALNPGGAPITWNFGDGNTQPGTSGVPVTHTYVHAGVYCVTFCVGAPVPNATGCTGNCATASATVPIEAAFTYTLGCNGCVNITDYSIVLASPTQVSYLWDFGDGFTSTSVVPPVHCYAVGGNYVVQLTLTYNDGVIAPCSSNYQLGAAYTPLSIAMNSPVCTGQLINMTSNPAGFLTYAWNFGDSLSSYIPSTSHGYSTAGPKTITLTVTDLLGNTCMASNNVNVLQGIGNCTLLPGYICPGSAATLTAATGAGFTYQWQQFNGVSYVTPSPNSITHTLSVTTPGWYHVIVTNANGCTCVSNLVEVKTAVNPKALIAASPSTLLCGPGMVMLSSVNEVPGFTSEWYANANYGTLLGTGNVYYESYLTTTTNFSLVLTNQYGCKDTCSMTIYVNPVPAQPVIVSNPPGVLCEGSLIQLTVTNYAANITWNTGASGLTITVSAAGIYTATYTDPVTGCSSKKNILINPRPPVALFPHLCDSIPCACTRPFSIYAPLPLLGPAAASYTIQWFNPAAAGSGPVLTNVATGSYYVVMTDPSTGCTSTSETYSVVVPDCDTCNCDGSSWEFMTMTKGPVTMGAKSNIPNTQNEINLECTGSYNLECNQSYTINAGFNCGDKDCTPKATWQLTLPDNSIQSGNAPLTFTPSQPGTYTLMLYGWCGDTKCDSCLITFKVDCPTGCDCKGSSWEYITVTENFNDQDAKAFATGLPKQFNPECGGNYALKCNQSYMVNASFICADQNCPPKVTWQLTLPDNSVQNGNAPFTFTASQSGTYTLMLYGWCGDTKCDSCLITFKADCPTGCDCKGSSWENITLTKNSNTKESDPNPKEKAGIPVNQQVIKLKCNGTFNLKCNQPYTLNAGFNCADASCPPNVTWQLTLPDNSIQSGTAPFTFTPAQTGSYTLLLYGWCGNQICDSCRINFKVDCPTGCDCKGSHWGEISLDTGSGKKIIKCGTPLALKCMQPFTMNAAFMCSDASCTGTVTYILTPSVGPAITGSMPLTYTPVQSGVYVLELSGMCGNVVCDKCIFDMVVECPPVEQDCCPHAQELIITGMGSTITQQSAGGNNYSLYTANITIAGGPSPYQQVKATVVDYQVLSNYEECIACKNLPFTWSSLGGTTLAGIGPVTTGATPAVGFNIPANPTENPREIVWDNGSPINLSTPQPTTLSLYLPAASALPCCELRVKVCILFSFTDTNCKRCEKYICGTILINKSQSKDKKEVDNDMLFE